MNTRIVVSAKIKILISDQCKLNTFIILFFYLFIAENHPCPFDEYILQEEYVSDWVTIDAFDDTEVYEEVNEDYDEAEETMHSTQESQHEEEPFDELIRNWALKTYQTHQALNGLLEILRKKTDYQLPKDARTLLKTRQCGKETYPIAGGEFWFPGVRSVLKDHFR